MEEESEYEKVMAIIRQGHAVHYTMLPENGKTRWLWEWDRKLTDEELSTLGLWLPG